MDSRRPSLQKSKQFTDRFNDHDKLLIKKLDQHTPVEQQEQNGGHTFYRHEDIRVNFIWIKFRAINLAAKLDYSRSHVHFVIVNILPACVKIPAL